MPRLNRKIPRNAKVYGKQGQDVMDFIEAQRILLELRRQLEQVSDEERRRQLTWAINELTTEFPHLKED